VQLFDVLSMVYAHTKNHMYFDKCQVPVNDTLNRLMLKYMNYRQAYYLDEKRQEELYQYLYTVDYGVDQYKGRYFADLSFTFLHWNLLEKLRQGSITVDQIDDNQFQKLIYNILPRCETVFHRLSDAGQKLCEVLATCHPNKQKLPVPPIRVHMPFVENFQGLSPFDMLLQDKKEDFRSANIMMQYLSAYGIDHHSRSVVKQLPKVVEKSLPNVPLYFDSRLQQTLKCKELNKGNLDESRDPPGVTVASYCLSDEADSLLVKKDDSVKQEDEDDKSNNVESDLKLEFFDVPKLH
jgi:hypothetical protein